MAALRRRTDWERALADHLEQAAARAFDWGRHDCLAFALEGVRRMSDADPGAPLRGRYAGAASALRYLRAHGGTLSALAQDLFARAGLAPIEPAWARRGDPVLLATADGAGGSAFDGALGLMLGARIATVPLAGSLLHVPRRLAVRAWRL